MKTIRKISKEYYVRQIMASWLVFYMLFFISIPARVVMAATPIPTNEGPLSDGFVYGAGNIAQPPGEMVTNVTVQTQRSIINWQTINTVDGENLNYLQDGVTGAAVLNKVTSGTGTEFYGNLNAQQGMRIFIVNPAGIIFGESAHVNVTQLVASSLQLTRDAFINGLDNGQFQFTEGGLETTGNVINNGSITAESSIALIGKEVINSGTLVANNGYVVLAAGDSVILTENGSNVAVEVLMPDVPEPDIHAFTVNNSSCGDGIEAYGENAQVVLAAGDVWSAALVKAHSDGSFDAVATVDITAVGGNVDIENDVIAEAVGNGVDDATASVTINAGGNVEIKAGSYGWWTNDTEITATAREGSNNTATVDIAAGGNVCVSAAKDGVKIQANADPQVIPSVLNQADVSIQGANVTIETSTDGFVDWFLSEDALVGAYADGASENRASVEITATGSEENGNVLLKAGGANDSALVEAVAQDGSVNSADVTIAATGNVDVLACSDAATVKAEASNELDGGDLVGGTIAGLTNTATINITADGGVTIKGQSNDDAIVEAVAKNVIDLEPGIPELGENEEVAVLDLKIQDLTNTANANITAKNGSVEIMGQDSGAKTIVKSTAANEIAVDIENGEVPVTANLTISGLENNADVTINADGECSNVVVQGDEGYGLVRAEAYNKLEVEHKGYSAQATLSLTVENLENNANVDITSANGNVQVLADDGYAWWEWHPYTASVEAEAYNEFVMDFEDEITTGTLMFDGIANNADIGITAAGNVEVLAEDGGEAKVTAEAWNGLDINKEASESITGDNVTNDASVAINAGGDVTVNAECEGDCSEAGIEALAHNEGDVDLFYDAFESEPGNITNTANVDISAGGDVQVIAKDCGQAQILAETSLGTDNTSNVTVNAGGDVLVKGDSGKLDTWTVDEGYWSNDYVYGWYWDGHWFSYGWHWENVWHHNYVEHSSFTSSVASIAAIVEDALNSNTAGVDITAGGNAVILSKYGGQATVEAYAGYAVDSINTANINITAEDGFVLAHAIGGTESTEEGFTASEVSIEATAEYAGNEEEVTGSTNNANITIIANDIPDVEEEEGFGDGDVGVIAVNGGKAEVEAKAMYSDENLAGVDITANGDVKVLAECEGQPSQAEIKALAEAANVSNTADVTINAVATTSEYVFEGDGKTYLEVDGGDVKVNAEEGGKAAITALAAAAGEYGDSETSNTANVTINATAAQGTRPNEVKPPVSAVELYEEIQPVYEVEAYTDGGDVKVIADKGGDAEIEALAMEGATNTSDVLICADGDVKVKGDRGGEAEIEALTKSGFFNTSSVAICAWGDEGVEVTADRGGDAGISSKAKDGGSNTASALIYAHQGGVQVVAERGGNAGITSQAKDGIENNAYVWINANGDVLVRAGQIDQPGCTAEITAEAEAYEDDGPTSTDAQVNVISNNGGVGVVGFNGGDAKIQAKASGGNTSNNAYAGVSAGGPLDISFLPEWMQGWFENVPNVLVKGFGEGSRAWIWSFANGYDYDDATNTAKTVVCTPGKVFVGGANGGYAAVKSWAFGWGDEADNTATTAIYAGNGVARGLDEIGEDDVDIVFAGNAEIYAKTKGIEGSFKLCLTESGEVAATDGGATLIVSNWASREDCPTCPPCPCEQQAAAAAVPPPLPQIRFPEASGCPGLMSAVASELGIPTQTIQVAFASASSVAPNIQPCSACQSLVNYAEILNDDDGSHMAALAQIFNTLAPPDAPFTPEMGSAIAAAFAENFDNPDMPQFAKAMEYIDAFTGYVSVLDDQMGSPVGDSTAFVMGKYGEPLTASNPNMTAYVQMRIAQTQGL